MYDGHEIMNKASFVLVMMAAFRVLASMKKRSVGFFPGRGGGRGGDICWILRSASKLPFFNSCGYGTKKSSLILLKNLLEFILWTVCAF